MTRVSRGRQRPFRSFRACRPSIHVLEDRVVPGESLLGLLLTTPILLPENAGERRGVNPPVTTSLHWQADTAELYRPADAAPLAFVPGLAFETLHTEFSHSLFSADEPFALSHSLPGRSGVERADTKPSTDRVGGPGSDSVRLFNPPATTGSNPPPAHDPTIPPLSVIVGTLTPLEVRQGGGGATIQDADTPTITEPRREGQLVSPNDVHMETGPFSDANPDAFHAASDWELWTVTPLQRIWAARATSGAELVHVHLADGRFENSHTGRSDLFPESNYRLRVRHQNNFGQNSGWAERNFRTATVIIGDPDLRWSVKQPGYQVDVMATGFQLPVNIAFVPYPGKHSGDPLYYVTELYGTIKVVTNGGEVLDYATRLLNFNPNGQFPGSGEIGLTGVVVDPYTGDVYASMVYSSNPSDDAAPKFPKIVRFESDDGGLTAARQTDILRLAGEVQGASHQISRISVGPDGMLYAHNGDGSDFRTALNLDSSRGKILRMYPDGTPAEDNPFFDPSLGRDPRNYVYAYGLRNPFGGDWRAADGQLYTVENGPDRNDRLAKIVRGRGYGWDNTDTSMTTHAIWNWDSPVAPVNAAFIQPETFYGSAFPEEKWGSLFVSESGPTYAPGPQAKGKRISEFVLDGEGNLVRGPVPLIEYNGVGRGSVAGMAAGPDGLYFTDLYKDDGPLPTTRGANILRVKYVGAVNFTVDVNAAPEGPLAAQFYDLSTTAPYYWFWDFGDGEWSEEQYPAHTYAKPGVYTVGLYIFGDSGEFYTAKTNLIGVGNVGLRAEYFTDINLRESRVRRIDPQLDFNWGLTLPDPELNTGGFSARWTGQVTPRFSETYNFHTYTGDGVRLWVNNQLIIDKWFDQPLADYTGTITLQAGVQYDLKMENYRRFNRGAAFLSWSSPSQAREIIPPDRLAPIMESSAVLAPTGLRVTPLAVNRAELTWLDHSENETGFKIERAMNLGGFVQVATVGPDVTTWTDKGLSGGNNYSYRVRAYRGAVNSPYTNQVNASSVGQGWTSTDIGAVGPLGSTNLAVGTFTVRGSGADIEFRADAFHYAFQRLEGNWQITARVATLQATDPWAKAGVMIRDSLAPNAKHAMMLVTPANGANFLRRPDTNRLTVNTPAGTGLAGTWVGLQRRGNLLTAFKSANGTTWTQVGEEILELGDTIYAGLALTSHNNGVLNVSTFDNVSLMRLSLPARPTDLRVRAAGTGRVEIAWTNHANNHTGFRIEKQFNGGGWTPLVVDPAVTSFTDTGLANGHFNYRVFAINNFGESAVSNWASVDLHAGPWASHDIGAVGPIGNTSVSGGIWTVRASGADIWGAADSFRFTYQPLTGNGEVIARVDSLQNTAPFAKAGVMMRPDLRATAAHAFMAVQPFAGLVFQRRGLPGFTPLTTSQAGAAPIWVRLVRQGNVITGYRSANGTSWTQVGQTTVFWPGTIYVGLALCANNNAVLNTAMFSNVTVRNV